MNVGGKIVIVDDVLTKTECLEAIKIFNLSRFKSSPQVGWYNDTLVYHTNNTDEYLLSLTKKIKDSIKFLADEIEVDWSQVVCWFNGSKQDYHKDTASSATVLTSITYLNDNFSGGETSFLNDIQVVPKIGRTVYFNGAHYVHGVNEVSNGIRYSLPIWYKIVIRNRTHMQEKI
jgi:hypothetical protein